MSKNAKDIGYLIRVEEIEKKVAANKLANKDPAFDILPEDHIFYRDHLLGEWEETKQTLETAKAAEMRLRKAIDEFAFDPLKRSGTQRIPLANGYQLKSERKINYGFAKDFEGNTNKALIDAALSSIEATGEVGKYIADKLVKWNPALSVSAYKELSPQLKALIDPVIVTTDGAPTLEIVPPKESKK